MKTFEEAVKDLKASNTVTKSGKEKKTFSRTGFDTLAQAMLNTADYSVDAVSTKGGELVTTKLYPVKDMREAMKSVLVDFGVDKQEAAAIEKDYVFSKKFASALYPITSEVIKAYCDKAGKKYDFITERDFKASLTINEVGSTTKEYSNIQKPGDTGTPEKFKVKTEKHKALKSSSKTPKWLKKKFK